MKLELEQILENNDNFHKLFIKFDSCLNSAKQTENDFLSLSISSRDIANNLKVKHSKLEIVKFSGDITTWLTL